VAKVADKVFSLIKDTVESQGVDLWDVAFLKEGASHYLRVFIDKEDGVNIDDCTNVSHAIDPLIDEADLIDVSYYLEVCSPGIERELKRDEHFVKSKGKKVKIKLYSPLDGKKDFSGILVDFDGNLTIDLGEKTAVFQKSDIAKITLDDFDM